MPQQKTLALLDASGYLYRAFHAIRPLTAPDGRPTNATFGFATMLRKLLSQRRPDAVAVCFDRPERTFRHEMDPEYKATRASMPCLLYTSPSPRDRTRSRMPSSA